MAETYTVRLEKESLIFSAAHFITFAGNICERLHGHNYGVAAEIEGTLDENQYVIDFILLRDTLQELVSRLDHHMLLPTIHKQIHVTVGDKEIEARFEDRRWVFPAADCVLLPIANTTAELLARHLGTELIDALRTKTKAAFSRVRVEVDENHGQWGCWEWHK